MTQANAVAEPFMKTLKYEEAYRQDYRDLAEARASIGRFLKQLYNEKRLHSALGCWPPMDFEQSLAPSAAQRRGRLERVRTFWSLRYEFSKAWGNLSPDEFFGKCAGAALAGPPATTSVR